MTYSGKIVLTNPKSVPFSLSNEFDDAFLLCESIMGCETPKDAQKVVNKMHRYKRFWEIKNDNPHYTRLSEIDVLGNVHYLVLYKA